MKKLDSDPIKQALEQVASELAPQLCLECIELAGNGEYSLALERANEAVEISPAFASGWHLKAMCELELKNYAECLRSIATCLKLDDPGEAVALTWRTKAQCHRATGQMQEADEAFARCLRLNPKDARSWNDRGGILMELGSFDAGLKCFRRAVDLMPEDPLHWENMGTALARQNRFAEAKHAFERAIAIDSTRHVSWYNLGAIAFQEEGDIAKAERCVERCLKENPGFVFANRLRQAIKDCQ